MGFDPVAWDDDGNHSLSFGYWDRSCQHVRVPARFLVLLALLLVYLGFSGGTSHSVLVAVWLLPAVWLAREQFLFLRGGGKATFGKAFLLVGSPLLILYLANGRNIGSYDNYGIQMTAASLVLDRKAEISAWTGQQFKDQVDCSVVVRYPVICTKAGVYAATPLGVLPFALPVFTLANWAGADLRNHHFLWRLSKWTAGWAVAAGMSVFFLIALAIAPFPIALLSTFFVGAASGVAAIASQGLWSHTAVLSGLLLSLAGYFLLFPKRAGLGTLLVGIGWSWMFAARLTSAPMIGLLALGFLFKSPQWGLLAVLAAGVGYLPWAWATNAIHGNPLGPQFVAVSNPSAQPIFSAHYLPQGLLGLTLGPGTGFFIYQAWALLLTLAFLKISRPARSWQKLFLVIGVAQLFLFASFYQWSGQHAWGTRYLLEVIPLAGLGLLPSLEKHWANTKVRRWAYGLGAVAFLIQVNGMILSGGEWQNRPLNPGQTMEERSLDWKDPAFLYPLPRW